MALGSLNSHWLFPILLNVFITLCVARNIGVMNWSLVDQVEVRNGACKPAGSMLWKLDGSSAHNPYVDCYSSEWCVHLHKSNGSETDLARIFLKARQGRCGSTEGLLPAAMWPSKGQWDFSSSQRCGVFFFFFWRLVREVRRAGLVYCSSHSNSMMQTRYFHFRAWRRGKKDCFGAFGCPNCSPISRE